MRRRILLPAVAIAAVTALLFARSLDGAFLDWDDDRNFLQNRAYRGLGWNNVRWMLTSALMGHWIPVTWLTLGVDHALWGMEPSGYHLTSVALHALNAALVFLVSRRLLAAGGASARTVGLGAGAAALVWALHPLRVESVAWITERRDVVSGAFYLATILAYLTAADRVGAARRRWLGASMAAYALALGAKSIVMPLPLILLVLDVYPLRRLPASWREWRAPLARRVLAEKIPYAALAVAGALTALLVLHGTLPLTDAARLPYAVRPLVFAYDLVFYLWKSLVPLGLSPIYELPPSFAAVWPSLAATALAAIALTVGFVLLRRRFPAGLAAWIAYVVSVAPVGGLVHNGPQIAADRYTYLASLPWAVLLGAGVAALASQPAPWARAAVAGVALWLAVASALTWQQIAVWRTSEKLYAHAIAVDPQCALCHRQLGAVLGNRDELELAIIHFRRSIALRPDLVSFRGNLGLALLKSERFGEAATELAAVVARHPDRVDARVNLGLALLGLGHERDALPHFEHAAALAPDTAPARYGLVLVYRALDRPADAAREAATLARLDPRLAAEAQRR